MTDIADFDFQHAFEPFARNHVVWGLCYRYTHASFDGAGIATFDPEDRADTLISAFIQDEVELIRDQLRFTIGSKFEYNNTTGFEIQPSARILWAPTPEHSLWGAVSRAVRTPSIGEGNATLRQAVIPPAPPFVPVPTEVVILGNPELQSEELLAFELGYRASPAAGLSFDIAGFYNLYKKLRDGMPGAPEFATSGPSRLIVAVDPKDKHQGRAYGFELAADWEVSDWWRLKAAYSLVNVTADDYTREAGNAPLHQASLRSMMDLGGGWEFDLWPRYVDNLSAFSIDSYISLDARLAWRPSANIELSLVGQNLLDSRRNEFEPEFLPMTATQNERGVYGKLTMRF